jgi:hypothetical protein
MHVMSPDYRVELSVPGGPRYRTATDACADITLECVLGSDVPPARGDNGPHPVLPLSRRAAPASRLWIRRGPHCGIARPRKGCGCMRVDGRTRRACCSAASLSTLLGRRFLIRQAASGLEGENFAVAVHALDIALGLRFVLRGSTVALRVRAGLFLKNPVHFPQRPPHALSGVLLNRARRWLRKMDRRCTAAKRCGCMRR